MGTEADFIHAAPGTLAQWVALFDVTQLPILADTAQGLAALRLNEEASKFGGTAT